MRTRIYKFTFLLSFCTVIFTASSIIYAQTVDELKGKISATTDELQKLEQVITKYKTDITNLGTQKNTLKTTINLLDLTRKKLETDIKITQTRVDATDLNIRQLSSDISYKEREISARVAALKEAILSIYERDDNSLAQVALSNESFSGLWNDFDSLEQFGSQVNENIELIKSLKADLEGKNKKKQDEKGKLLGLKVELGDQKKVTEDTKKQKSQLLVQTSNTESQYQKTLKEKIALRDALEQELRDYESTLKFILDPTSIPPRGKKVFSVPIEGLRIPQDITQNFGKTSSSGRLYASGTHNGTDFRAIIGTRVRAMLGGTVIGTGDTDIACRGASYGKWVLVRHNNGLASLYAHFSLIKVSQGDTVNTGDVLGLSGNTGYSTGPHLHLTVFAADAVKVENRASKSCGGRMYTLPLAAINAYLDPMDYL